MNYLPPAIPLPIITKWLPEIFPERTANRNYVVREMAAKTVFVLFYVGAVAGRDRWLRPNQVTRMTDRQSRATGADERERWYRESLRHAGSRPAQGHWYAVDSREPIRDETLRGGLVALGAVVERSGLPTTSSKPRYALSGAFAELLIHLNECPADARASIERWQGAHLTPEAVSRIRLLRQGTVRSSTRMHVRVSFPNGEARLMHPGPSTEISKAIVEQFATRFLREPAVILVSESGNKLVARDDALASDIGLKLDKARLLPDLILADVDAAAPKVFFVEVVATDGAITEARRRALLETATAAGYNARNVVFISAFQDRASTAFRKHVAEIAWGTYAWFASEPEQIVLFGRQGPEVMQSIGAPSTSGRP